MAVEKTDPTDDHEAAEAAQTDKALTVRVGRTEVHQHHLGSFDGADDERVLPDGGDPGARRGRRPVDLDGAQRRHQIGTTAHLKKMNDGLTGIELGGE